MRPSWVLPVSLLGLGACVRYVDSTDLAEVEESVTAIAVTGTLGHLTVKGKDAGPIHIERVVHAKEGSYPPQTHTVSGGSVHISSKCDESHRCEMRHTIEAPRNVPVSVDLDVAYVEIKGMNAKVDIDLETGNVDALDLRSKQVDARVGAGDIDLIFLEPPERVDAEIDVGTLTIAVPEGAYRCELDEELVHTEIAHIECKDDATAVIHARVEVGKLRLLGK